MCSKQRVLVCSCAGDRDAKPTHLAVIRPWDDPRVYHHRSAASHHLLAEERPPHHQHAPLFVRCGWRSWWWWWWRCDDWPVSSAQIPHWGLRWRRSHAHTKSSAAGAQHQKLFLFLLLISPHGIAMPNDLRVYRTVVVLPFCLPSLFDT